ncbi:MAG: methionine adenosyltransferase [Actinomycetia bacterium]|nr:methionine adenosyltransferase [Actinomycetes bacterium]
MARIVTAESVTQGHPDKVADAISDAVLDAMLAQDAHSRTAVETLVANGVVVVTGEATTEAYVDITQVARDVITGIGYDDAARGLDGRYCGVLVALNNQSPDISQGVDDSWEVRHGVAADAYDRQGAGDQGIMFGFACDETESLMPTPIDMAHRLAERLAGVRRDGVLPYLRPDGKTQVSLEYEAPGRPVRLDTVIVSAQHDAGVDQDAMAADLLEHVVTPVVSRYAVSAEGMRLLVNPTGQFVVGGPLGDSGLTGRKIIADTYGGAAHHGGGAFSGKDPSKVDRSAAYALRWVAKTVVAAGLARRCEAQVAYAIGKARPVGLYIDTHHTGVVPDKQIRAAVESVFDLRPAAIIDALDLLRPIYGRTTCYGHFGRPDEVFTWENTDRAEALAAAVRG